PPPPVAAGPATVPSIARPTQTGLQQVAGVLVWAAWIAMWVSAVAAGLYLGAFELAQALFAAVLLAVTALPWLYWVRPGARRRVAASRQTTWQGLLAILVAAVLALSGHYVWAIPFVVGELAVGVLYLIVSAPRPARA
ncbi:MAG: hypothetical protein ACREQM_05425, partial [Candidatus Dormibacteraceae bacterium]